MTDSNDEKESAGSVKVDVAPLAPVKSDGGRAAVMEALKNLDADMPSASKKASSGKAKRKVAAGILNIKTSFNNTIVSLCDVNGNVLKQASGGSAQFKGSRKGTAFAAQEAAEILVKYAKDELEMKSITVNVKGPGAGREAMRVLAQYGIDVTLINDRTRVPFNGCRPPKERRV